MQTLLEMQWKLEDLWKGKGKVSNSTLVKTYFWYRALSDCIGRDDAQARVEKLTKEPFAVLLDSVKDLKDMQKGMSWGKVALTINGLTLKGSIDEIVELIHALKGTK